MEFEEKTLESFFIERIIYQMKICQPYLDFSIVNDQCIRKDIQKGYFKCSLNKIVQAGFSNTRTSKSFQIWPSINFFEVKDILKNILKCVYLSNLNKIVKTVFEILISGSLYHTFRSSISPPNLEILFTLLSGTAYEIWCFYRF